jgi:O-antigen ligase
MFFLQLLMIAFLFFSALIHYSGIPNGLIESKAYFFVVGAAPLIMIGCLQIARAAGKQVVVFNGIDIAYTAYTFFILVNSIAWQQALDEMLMVQVSSLFVYWLLKNLFLQAKDNHWLSIGLCLPFLLIGLAQAAYGLLQLYGYYPSLHSGFKLTGAFHNPGPFGVFLVSSFAFALGWYFFAEVNSSYKIFLRCVCIAVCVAVVLVLPATQSRTAWAACAASSALLLWYKYDIGTYWVKLKSRKVFLVAFIVVITSSLISVLVLAYQFKAASAAGRLVTWQISMRMVSDEPLFGHGFGSFAHRYGNYQADYFAVHPDETSKIQVADKVEYAFNDYLQILIEQGAVGFALFVGVIFFVFKSVPWQHLRRQPLLLASIASWMAVLVSGLFSYPFELAPTWFNFVFFMISGESSAPSNSGLWPINQCSMRTILRPLKNLRK